MRTEVERKAAGFGRPPKLESADQVLTTRCIGGSIGRCFILEGLWDKRITSGLDCSKGWRQFGFIGSI